MFCTFSLHPVLHSKSVNTRENLSWISKSLFPNFTVTGCDCDSTCELVTSSSHHTSSSNHHRHVVSAWICLATKTAKIVSIRWCVDALTCQISVDVDVGVLMLSLFSVGDFFLSCNIFTIVTQPGELSRFELTEPWTRRPLILTSWKLRSLIYWNWRNFAESPILVAKSLLGFFSLFWAEFG